MSYLIDPLKQCGELLEILPKPNRIILQEKTEKRGFLVEKCNLLERLEKSFEKYFLEQVLYFAKKYQRKTLDTAILLKNRVFYLNIFKEGIENAIIFDSGREFLKIFLLAHLKQYKNFYPEIPKILSSVVPDIPEKISEELKLNIFNGLWQEVGDLLKEKETKAYNLWEMIKSAPQFFLEKELSFPKNFPWYFGEVFYQIPSDLMRKYYSETILKAKDFLNSNEGKKIVLSFFKREISLEEALNSEEILNLLQLSEEALKFMKALSLNLRYGEIFEDYLNMIYFCKREEKEYYFEDKKLSEETKPYQFSLAGVINPLIKRYFFVLKIPELEKSYNNLVFMDEKNYGIFLKEKEKFEREILAQAEKLNVYFEKYLKDGIVFTSRNPKELFDFVLQIFFSFTERESSLIQFKNIKGFLGKGSFYLLPFLYPSDKVRYEIFGTSLEDALETMGIETFQPPYIIISYPILEILFENLRIDKLDVYKTIYGKNLKVNTLNYAFILIPYLKDLAILKPKIEGEIISGLEPYRIKNKISEVLESLKKVD